MLFNSYSFLFIFFPVCVIGFFLIGKYAPRVATFWLAGCSVAFYGWTNSSLVWILAGSVGANYAAGRLVAAEIEAGRRSLAKAILWNIIAGNLAALAYFKYANFLIANVADATSLPIDWKAVALPIGISFFTFTQIAFQVDNFRGKVDDKDLLRYVLFVTYFPHLIAGPILHHAEMMPQFRNRSAYIPSMEAISVGITVFLLGLFKKLILADCIAPYADHVFDPSHAQHLATAEAWRGVLAYTLQIYFDFSAYCDMAIGLSQMLNITLPANFESPYKARSIVDFWRRWHMTLSRFLRDYLYIPLGGNRLGGTRRYANLAVTMVLGGLWHGAGWTFIVWGALHGAFLCVNHAWNALSSRSGTKEVCRSGVSSVAAWALTFISVMSAWVFFRAADLTTALNIIRAMAGVQTASGPGLLGVAALGLKPLAVWLGGDIQQVVWLFLGLAITLFGPNIRQIMAGHSIVLPFGGGGPERQRAIPGWLMWTPNAGWAVLAVGLFVASFTRLNHVSPFLYFQF